MKKISTEVGRFAERMQYKLDLNKHKECNIMNPDDRGRGWYHCEYDYLLWRLREETKELQIALDLLETNSTPETLQAAANECADVANFAMMIFDKLTTLN